MPTLAVKLRRSLAQTRIRARPARTRHLVLAGLALLVTVGACAPAPSVAPAPVAAPAATAAAVAAGRTLAARKLELGPASAPAVMLSGDAPALGRPVLSPDGLFIPPALDTSRPVAVLLALHGMGGSGARIAQRLQEYAVQNNWILVAPSMVFRDYMDPEQVRLDDQETLPRLRDLLDGLPLVLPEGIRVAEQVYVYGFSRGGQLAHRFALFYPERVAGVATLSAGSYTLPKRTFALAAPSVAGGAADLASEERPLAFPYGVADLERYSGRPFDAQAVRGVPFLVEVGGADVATDQVPRPFDPYIGTTRLERARRFTDALQALGADATLEVAAGVGHDETAAMRARASSFLLAHPPTR